MAEIVPFRGVRFTARSGAPLSALLAPHYHLVSPQGREALLARDRHNIAHLTMGDGGVGGHAGEPARGGGRYAGVAETWASWLAEGVLRRDAAAALYPLVQTFEAPDGHRVQRRGFLAAVRLHELEEGVVIPHQRTLAAPRADRLELLRACRVNFTPVLGLYADERGLVAAALDEATAGQAAAEAETDDGVHHRLWQVDRPETVARLASLVEDQRLILADGHHRYETALAYRRSLEAEGNPLPTTGGHHYVLMCLCALSDPGLFVYPVHRLVRALGSLSLAAFLQTLERFFRVVTLEEDLRRPSGRAWAIARLAEHAGRSTAFLMVTAEDRKGRILTLRDDVDLDQAGLPQSETLRMVDATVLHGVVLERMLGLPGAALEGQELTYVNDAEEAVGRVLSGEYSLGFLVNPAPTWQVQAVAEDGKTLPPRSTLFRPVLQSGLVMREVDPRVPA